MTRQSRLQRILPPLLLIGFGLLIALRSRWPERALDQGGAAALWDHAFALALTMYLVIAAAGLGSWILRWIQVHGKLTDLERFVYSIPLGLGVLSLGLMALGLTSTFSPPWIAALVFIALLAGISNWSNFAAGLSAIRGRIGRLWSESRALGRATLLACCSIWLASGLHALTPAWTFDALMYHLQAPRLYLQAERLVLLPDLWQANGPMGIELLYAVGVAFGSTTVSRCLHLVLTVLLVFASFVFALRHLGEREAWLSVVILSAVPILPVWGSIANIDSGWALYEALGFFAVIGWALERDRGWLYLAAVSIGFGLSTKYLALAGLATVTIFVSANEFARSRRSVHALAILAATAVVVGSPWYLLNIFRAGNPIYPFVFGGPGWGEQRLAYLMSFLNSFGGKAPLATLALTPIRLYTNRTLYTTFMSGIEFPSLLFPLALLLPITKPGRALKLLGALVLLRFLLWGLSSQQTRFLLPLFPALSILTAHSLLFTTGSTLSERGQRILVSGLVGGLVVTTIVVQYVLWMNLAPGGIIVGTETKDSFLRRVLTIYPALAFLQDNLPQDSRVLMLWDGQSYYCDERCVPDAEQSKWTQIVAEHDSAETVGAELREEGITHLLAKVDSLNFFLQHDPEGWHTRAINFYLEEFRPKCTETVFANDETALDRITCGP